MDNIEKKGKTIFASIALVVGVVILISISGLIVGEVLGSSVFTDVTTNGTNSNETLTAVDNATITSFAILSSFPSATCTLSEVFNATGGEAIGSGNYTQPTSCQIFAGNDSVYIGGDWNVTYAYTNTDFANLGGVNITQIAEAFGEFVSGLITFLGIIGIIIGIVWLLSYLAPLFSKEEGLQSFGEN